MLEIDASVFVIFAVVWILVFILTKIFFKPLQKVMRKRESWIKDGEKIFQKSTETYEQASEEIEEKLKSARARALKIKEKFDREALKEREQMLAEISAETRNQVDEAKKQLEEQVKILKKELESRTEQLAENIEKRLLN